MQAKHSASCAGNRLSLGPHGVHGRHFTLHNSGLAQPRTTWLFLCQVFFTRMKSCPCPSQPCSPLHSDAGNLVEGGSHTSFGPLHATQPALLEKGAFPSPRKGPGGKEMHSGELGQLLVLDGQSQAQRVPPR